MACGNLCLGAPPGIALPARLGVGYLYRPPWRRVEHLRAPSSESSGEEGFRKPAACAPCLEGSAGRRKAQRACRPPVLVGLSRHFSGVSPAAYLLPDGYGWSAAAASGGVGGPVANSRPPSRYGTVSPNAHVPCLYVPSTSSILSSKLPKQFFEPNLIELSSFTRI